MRRQDARDRTSGEDEIGQSHLTLETKADYLTQSGFVLESIGKETRCNLTKQHVPISSASRSSLHHTAISKVKSALKLTKPGIQHFTGRWSWLNVFKCEKDQLKGCRCGHMVTFSHILLISKCLYWEGAEDFPHLYVGNVFGAISLVSFLTTVDTLTLDEYQQVDMKSAGQPEQDGCGKCPECLIREPSLVFVAERHIKARFKRTRIGLHYSAFRNWSLAAYPFFLFI